MLTGVPGLASGDDDRPAAGDSSSLIDQIVREGARRMLAEALQAEVDAYIAAYADQRDEHGHRLVVCNGSHQSREVLTSVGAVEVTAPRVNDKRVDPDTGQRPRFSSAISPAFGRGCPQPPWALKTPKITEVLPLLYLLGLFSGDFVPALGQFLGSAQSLSAPVITKLTEQWKAEQRAFAERDLFDVDYVYLWADGIHVNIRLEEAKLCLLVMIGVRADGRKELVALADGYREATESWADLLRDAKRAAGAPRCWPPATARSGSGPRCVRCSLKPGSSAAGSTRSPTSWRRCPSLRIPGRRKALAQIWNAEDKRHALDALTAFEAAYGAKFPKAATKITEDVEELLAFYDYPAEHWIHLRTTNPIESTFATACHRTKVTKGPGSRAAGLAMAFKLIESAQHRWRAVNGPRLVALVRAGARFENGNSSNDPTNQEVRLKQRDTQTHRSCHCSSRSLAISHLVDEVACLAPSPPEHGRSKCRRRRRNV
jgi:transposase-like protein